MPTGLPWTKAAWTGLIPLRDYYCLNLQANGVMPLPVAAWDGHNRPPFDYYALLGLPEEKMEPQERMGARGPQIGYRTTLSLVGVQALQRPPADESFRPSRGLPAFSKMAVSSTASRA